jgi:hypothetical protein
MQNQDDDKSASGSRSREQAARAAEAGRAISHFNKTIARASLPRVVQALRPPTKDSEPDWEKWTRKDTARLWELAALLAGLDPDSIDAWQTRASADGIEFEPVNEQFNTIFDLAESSHKAGKLKALGQLSAERWRNYFLDVEVPEFLRWARSKRLNLPPELAELINKSPADSEDAQAAYLEGWKDICAAMSERVGHSVSERQARRVLEEEGIPVDREHGRVRVLARGLSKLDRD